jgi:hypothetical protein
MSLTQSQRNKENQWTFGVCDLSGFDNNLYDTYYIYALILSMNLEFKYTSIDLVMLTWDLEVCSSQSLTFEYP